ncbi:hypothetical protein BJ508DRAFT_360086 [Ascobolus immersus RN42]|uniref:Uncharacterized protein n=1 Tax=Ascobolus immersus RN42 TaxID=1160509 RepID=A0A3N4IE80_ASCIM|nr:hypothetical protein BJ508DRAFT_360086 [Ascobolus immersus RN42]
MVAPNIHLDQVCLGNSVWATRHGYRWEFSPSYPHFPPKARGLQRFTIEEHDSLAEALEAGHLRAVAIPATDKRTPPANEIPGTPSRSFAPSPSPSPSNPLKRKRTPPSTKPPTTTSRCLTTKLAQLAHIAARLPHLRLTTDQIFNNWRFTWRHGYAWTFSASYPGYPRLASCKRKEKPLSQFTVEEHAELVEALRRGWVSVVAVGDGVEQEELDGDEEGVERQQPSCVPSGDETAGQAGQDFVNERALASRSGQDLVNEGVLAVGAGVGAEGLWRRLDEVRVENGELLARVQVLEGINENLRRIAEAAVRGGLEGGPEVANKRFRRLST